MGEDLVDMRMEVDAVAEGLDHSHHSWHDLKACGCVQEFHKCAHRRETKRIDLLCALKQLWLHCRPLR